MVRDGEIFTFYGVPLSLHNSLERVYFKVVCLI